jgi:hypothetical protein
MIKLKYVLLLPILFGLFSCEDKITDIPDFYTLEIDGRLDTTAEGLYKLKLISTNNSEQTIHRVTGQLLNNGEEPYPPQYVDWESSHVWYLSDTTHVIIRRTINVLGEWVNIDTTYVTQFQGDVVPTINPTSVSGTNGEINTVIAPVESMRGDTLTVRCTFRDLEETIQIILE